LTCYYCGQQVEKPVSRSKTLLDHFFNERIRFLFRLSLDERKEYLANTAAIVFCEKGYQATSLRDVAGKAKISKAGVYHYFKTKEDILALILIQHTDLFLRVLKERIKESQAKDLDAKQAFQELIRTYANHLNQNKEVRLLVLRERHQLTRKNKSDLYKREQAIFHLLKNELKKIPDIDKKKNPSVISFLIISMSHWLGYWFRESGGLGLEEIIDQNIRIIFNGIFKNPS
jgi:AcrR family transcriptional regulator